jgi:uncharacterized protein DUF6510
MDAWDGNAIAGTLVDAFGSEMTTAVATCATCRASRRLAEYAVYLGGPGVVVRCRDCRAVAMVLVEIAGRICVDAMGLSVIRPAVHRDSP